MGQQVTVDGSRGCVYEGRADVRLAWAEVWKKRRAEMANIKTRTKVYLNLAEPSLAEVMARENVDGVGLLRAEFIVADYIKEHPRLCLDEGRPEDFIAEARLRPPRLRRRPSTPAPSSTAPPTSRRTSTATSRAARSTSSKKRTR